MSKLDLEWIRVFVEVYRLRSVSRAADELGIAQPTASLALDKLRVHFGDRLFARSSRGMDPTSRAQLLYPELASIAHRLEAMRTEGIAFDPATSARRFSIAMTDISEVVLLPTLLGHIRRSAPLLQIEAEPTHADIAHQIEAGEVDLAVGFLPQLEKRFFQETLFDQDFVCLAAVDHPRVQGRLTKKMLAEESHVVVSAPGTGHAVVDRILMRHGIERRIALQVVTFLGAARIVARTDLLAVVPRMLSDVLEGSERLQRLETPVSLPGYGVKQHWHARVNHDPGHVWLRQLMITLFRRER